MTVAHAVKDQIQQIGGGFMFSREAKEFGRTTGVDGFIGPYMRGRCGVLGEVDADKSKVLTPAEYATTAPKRKAKPPCSCG